jgi:NhaP-type Na+/H+ or K+/H+ antiporter
LSPTNLGVGAVFYVSYTQSLFPETGKATTEEEDNLTAVMFPIVLWLVLVSIVVHGLSIPALDAFYRFKGIQPIADERPAEVMLLSENEPLPNNAFRSRHRNYVILKQQIWST